MLGGALFSLVLIRWLDPFQVALGVGVLNLAMASVLLMHGQGVREARGLTRGRLSRFGGVLVLILSVAVLLVAAWPLGRELHWTTLTWQYPGLRFARDSIYGRIAVTGSGEQRVFFENGLLFFETQGVSAEQAAHLPLLAHPAPRRVLLVGGGVSGTLAEILLHPSVREVHYVELDPLVVAAARKELPPGQAAPFDDPRVTLAHQDGRVYVRQQQGQEPFDVVILGFPEPATGQLNRFYTQEFFAEVKAILAPGGVFALSLPWQENYPGPALQRLAASMAQTLAAEFPEIEPLPGEQLTLLASEAPLVVDPGILSGRLAERAIQTRWVVPSYLDYILAPVRVAQAQGLLQTVGAVRLNRDLEPISYFYDLTVWLSRFSGGLSRLAAGALPLKLGWLALLLAGLVVLLRLSPPRTRRRRTVSVTVGLTGLAGMILEVGVLLAFQVVHGYVYGRVGLIVTAFMAGLALGSALANAAARGWRRASSLQHRWDPRYSPWAALAWIQGGIALFALGFPLVAGLAPPAGIFSLLALLGGGLTGLAFPVAVACLEVAQGPAVSNGADRSTGAVDGRSGHMAGLLYGADLVGGCVGAVTASVFLVPILGIPQTCLAVAIVGVAGLAITCL
jgi:spermidine synthase